MAPQDVPDRSIKISVDRGGTFTDVHASWPQPDSSERKEVILKLLSVDPAHYVDAPREGVRRILEMATGKTISRDSLLPVDKIDSLRLSTTVATNALLERKGARHALLVTKGFRDLLEIGNQSRPKIFALNIQRPSVLYDSVIEVDERVTLVGYTYDPKREERQVQFDGQGNMTRGYDGQDFEPGEFVKGLSGETVQILQKLDENRVKSDLQELRHRGFESIAVVLMHSFTFPAHEQKIAEIANSLGFTNISISSSSLPMIRIVPRGQSTTVDAYLTPILKQYIDGFYSGFEPSLRETNKISSGDEAENSTTAEKAERATSVEFMRSDGGLTDVKGFSGLRSILSGPAGGVVGFALTSWEKGGPAVIGLDMGGTSTDVSRYDGNYETVFETTTAGVTIQSPQLNINTVAAGGGSRLFWRNGLFVCGPESAGSDPGPSCYKKGGSPAVTDANLVLGRLLPQYFPKIFGPNENEILDVGASRTALETLRKEINAETSQNLTLEQVAWGFIKVANETMSRPIRSLTESRGYDASKHILAPFGGAGGQHACAIAHTLGIKTIVVHQYSSVLSAYGMALAERVVERQEPAAETWSAEGSAAKLEQRLHELGQRVQQELTGQGFPEDRIELHPYLNMRYNGTDSALMVHQPQHEKGENFAEAFARAYKEEFGFSMSVEITVDDVRVRGVGKSFDTLGKSVFAEQKELKFVAVSREPGEASQCNEIASVYFEQTGRVNVPVYLLGKLTAGDLVHGPAMILDDTQTVVVDPHATAKITSKHILIELQLE